MLWLAQPAAQRAAVGCENQQPNAGIRYLSIRCKFEGTGFSFRPDEKPSFKASFPSHPLFPYLAELVVFFEAKSVNLGKIQTLLTADT